VIDRERARQGPRALKERGSPEWCWQTVDYLQSHMKNVSSDWERAQEVLDELKDARAWKVIPADQPYGTLDGLLRAEICLDERTIQDLIRKAELAAHGGDRRSAQFQGDVIPLKNTRGTSATHTIRRLRRDGHDALAAEVERGELAAAKAARQAGYRRQRAMTIPKDSADRAFARLCGGKDGTRGMDPDQLEKLADLLWRHFHPEDKEN